MKIILFLQLMILSLGVLSAQSIERSVLATAGNFSNENVQLSWTIGESITETYQSLEVNLTQGFQQEEILLTKLPLELLSFKAERTNKSTVNLDWETTAEINVDGFLLERKLEGESEFQTIRFIESKGGKNSITNYNFEDDNYHFGNSYYRLKSIDHDGSFEYSEIKVVEGTPLKHNIEAFPIPFDNVLNISISPDKRKRIDEVIVELLDFNGKLIQKNIYSLNGTGIQLKGVNQLPAGAYYVRISSSKTIIGNLKVIKIKD